MNFPKKCLVDTNVPKTANLAVDPNDIPNELAGCVLACVEAVEHVIKKRGLVIDAGNEIYDEYRQKLSFKGQPGVGDGFLKWVHDHRWSLPDSHRVTITKNGESYDQFPIHDNLNNIDRSDKKFIAVSNAHSEKPPILEATDSKWWGWKDTLRQLGISVVFLCPKYVEAKYADKMGA